ncbi:MAG: dipeptidase [Planctomycetota bacterium]|nr:dipeptidase [Planctomycetota bacterium]
MPSQTFPVFDAHVDSIQRALDLGHDLGVEGPGHLDLVRGARGGLAAVVLTAWVDPSFIDGPDGGATGRAQRLIGSLGELIQKHPDQVAWVGNGDDLDRVRGAGRIAAISGIEGGHALADSIDELDRFFESGVRMLTLVWNNHLSWIRSCQALTGEAIPEGLSALGRQMVRRMNELGIVVDVSHAAESSLMDVLEVSTQPIVASHSGCLALNDHPRNMSDDGLRALAAAGGVLGVVFCTPFLSKEARKEEAAVRLTPEYKALKGQDETDLHTQQSAMVQERCSPFPLQPVVDHVMHAIQVMGIDHVGLGSDYDGIQRTPADLKDASCYGRLGEALLAAGLTEDQVQKVFYGNMERVFRRATGPGTRASESSASS